VVIGRLVSLDGKKLINDEIYRLKIIYSLFNYLTTLHQSPTKFGLAPYNSVLLLDHLKGFEKGIKSVLKLQLVRSC
jgi:hypothetical protein